MGDHVVCDANGQRVASISTFDRGRTTELDARIEATAAVVIEAPELLRLLGAITDAWIEANGQHEPRWLPGAIGESAALVARLRRGEVNHALESEHAV